MSTLEEMVSEALASTETDAELAKALVASGALEEIIRRGTYNDQAVQERLGYATSNTLRAAVSRARKGGGHMPLPIIESRRWSRSAVDDYRRKARARRKKEADSARSTTSNTPVTVTDSTASNASNTSDVDTTSITTDNTDTDTRTSAGITPGASFSSSASISGGTSVADSRSISGNTEPGSMNGAEHDAHHRAE